MNASLERGQGVAWAEIPVGQIVAERLGRARVFEALGIDYCCHGSTPLGRACAERGYAVEEVVAAVEAADARDNPTMEPDCSGMTMTELADHIERTHHAYLRDELPRIAGLIQKVVEAHGEREPRLRELAGVFAALKDELELHMLKEERVLFPIVRRLDAATGPVSFHCGSVDNPIRVMEHEHDDAGAALARMRELTDAYTPPSGACTTYRALLDALARFERDMHLHIHKENNILFPRASRAEAELATVASA